jgi:hypothetical protein
VSVFADHRCHVPAIPHSVTVCINAVRRVEADDPEGIKHPRSSRTDDCSGIALTAELTPPDGRTRD